MKFNALTSLFFNKKLHQYLLLSFLTLTTFFLFLKFDNGLLLLLRLNVYFSLIYIAIKIYMKDLVYLKKIAFLLIVPIIFFLLSYLSKGTFHLNSYLINLTYAFFFLSSILLIGSLDREKIQTSIFKLLKVFIFVYTLVQLVYLKFEFGPLLGVYGTTKNPHFLALYSALCFYLSLYFYNKSTSKWRFGYILLSLTLLVLVLNTSSRPVWIAIIISLFFYFHQFDTKKALKLLVPFFLIQYLLIYTNAFNYSTRFVELAQNITTEERVTIWQDTLELQKKASMKEWLIGHGTKSFYKDFQSVSRYHEIKDFKSPHNVFLELLYSSGLVGLGLIIYIFYFIYSQLIMLRNNLKNESLESTIALMTVTTIIILNGLNFPLFSTSFIFPLTLIFAYIFLQRGKISQNN